jgi:two-component system sensor histidine kinase/response regulator
LTISRELTDLMGGAIGAESEPGKGSTFRFAIPFTTAETGVLARVPATELGGLRVLVVDDNATNRRVFEAYVASWGMRPDVAGDAAAAFAQLQRAAQTGDPYDIALLDFNMPAENGLELATRITADPALRHTRLILLTSSGQIAADDPSSGIRYHLTKPVRQSRLLDAIGQAMAIDVDARPQPGRQPERRPERPEPAAIGRRILVAEDQHVNWMLIERILTKRGDWAVNAADGQRVLEMLASEHYDLVLMDCQMPVLDGYDTAREIRQREDAEHSGRVPIVAMTANAMQGDRERCLAAGMDDYIPKPIDPDVLDEILARWLPPGQQDAPVLDPARLEQLRSLFTREEMTETLRDVAATITTELDNISQAITRNDRGTLAAAAHRVKNSAGMIGASALADAAAQLQSQADTDRPSAPPLADTTVPPLHYHWHATRTAIEAELAQAD